MAPVASALVADAGAPAGGVGSVDDGAEVAQRPEVDDAAVLDDGAGVLDGDTAGVAGAGTDEAVAGELPGRDGFGGGFAAGGGAAAGAGRAGGTVGIADFAAGLPTAAARGAVLGLAAAGVAARLAAVEPGAAPIGVGAAEEGDCDADAAGACFEATDVRTPDVVVVLAGRVVAPEGTDVAGARAPAAACAAAVDAAASLAARSLAGVAVAREAEPVAAADAVLVAGVLGAAPPAAGMPNPAGDLVFPAVAGVWAAAGAGEGADVGAEGCDVFEAGAAGVDVDACDVALEDAGADAPLPAESEATGPSGSNN